jgi:hypothetical protein
MSGISRMNSEKKEKTTFGGRSFGCLVVDRFSNLTRRMTRLVTTGENK